MRRSRTDQGDLFSWASARPTTPRRARAAEADQPSWTPRYKRLPTADTPRRLPIVREVEDRELRGWPATPDLPEDLHSFDRYVVSFSGGKDSVACFLYLLWLGVPRERIELWHNDVDGREGSTLMDWPCTRGYVEAFARAFGVPVYFSWLKGGFEGELLKENARSQPIVFEAPEGTFEVESQGEPNTRLRWPATTANLMVRWCSPSLKIKPAEVALRAQERFNHSRTLFLTGERAQESTARAHYEKFEEHRTFATARKGRYVMAWRAVHGWKRNEVWSIIRHFRVNPHPAYRLGWGRVSCAGCIFGSPDQFASLYAVNPSQWWQIARLEQRLGNTIKALKGGRQVPLASFTSQGEPYRGMRPEDIAAATSPVWSEPIILDRWELPRGAFGETEGPT